MTYFNNPQNLEELKSQYKELVKKYHPDLNRDRDTTSDMVNINNEYEQLFDRLKHVKTKRNGKEQDHSKSDVDDGFREILEKIVWIPNIDIEINGLYVWVGGNTYPHKEYLNTIGFNWAKGAKQWYWKPEFIQHVKRTKGTSIDARRAKYGYERVNGVQREQIN